MAVARYAEAEYVEVDVPWTIVALTPLATYGVVFVAVNAGVLTKSVTVCAPASLGDGVVNGAADEADIELSEDVVDASVAAAAEDREAGEADEADVKALLETDAGESIGQSNTAWQRHLTPSPHYPVVARADLKMPLHVSLVRQLCGEAPSRLPDRSTRGSGEALPSSTSSIPRIPYTRILG